MSFVVGGYDSVVETDAASRENAFGNCQAE